MIKLKNKMANYEIHPKYRELGNPPKTRQFEFYCENCDKRFPSEVFNHSAALKNQAINFGAGLITKFFGGNKIIDKMTDAVSEDRDQTHASIEKERAKFLAQAEEIVKKTLVFDSATQKWLCQKCFLQIAPKSPQPNT